MHRDLYRRRIAGRVNQLTYQASSFLDVCSLADGIFPTEILRELNELNKMSPDRQIEHLLSSVGKTNHEESPSFPQMENLLIDYDWRFQKSSAERLFEIARKFRNVLCVGTPTIFALLAAERKSDLLIEQNGLYKSFIPANADQTIFEPIEDSIGCTSQKFQAVILDPPWYLESYHLWLNAALSFVEEKGFVFLPLLPPLLREGAEQELTTLLGWLSTFGQTSILPFVVRYETPSFEISCLRAIGLPALNGWRTARIAAVRIENIQPLKHGFEKRKSNEKWSRYIFKNGMTAAVKYRNRTQGNDSHFFVDSVSRRDERRNLIDAVSSRNLAASIKETDKLEKSLEALSKSSELFDDPLLAALSKDEIASC
jgi:hypothetical protein